MPNIELLLKVADLVDQEGRYDQGSWGTLAHNIWAESPRDPKKPLCGTTACIAGWAAILSDYTATKVEMTADYSRPVPMGSHRPTRPIIVGYKWAKVPTPADIADWEYRYKSNVYTEFYETGLDYIIGFDFTNSISSVALILLDLGPEFREMFRSDWLPRPGMTAGQALRAIANGASYAQVTHPDLLTDEHRLTDEDPISNEPARY